MFGLLSLQKIADSKIIIRCSSGAGPEPFEYYCSTGDPFMGAYAQQGAGDKEIREGELEDEVHFDAETRKEDVIEVENDGDESLEDCESKRSFEEIGDKEPLNDENEGEEYFEDETCNLSSPQSLWPLSPAFWQGLVPGWEQSLPPSSQPVNYNNYSDFLSEPPTSRPECSVAIGPHAHGGRPDASRGYDLLESSTPRNQNPTVGIQCRYAEELPTSSTFGKYLVANNGYSLFVPGSPGLANQGSEAGNQNSSAGKTTSSKKPAARESRPQASHEQEAFHKRAAVGEVRSSQQPTPKKDSRGWGEHEKAFVKLLMEEVIAEGEHDRTEERWKVISRRLSSRYSVNRTWTAVKNMWNRHGRNDFNIDERKVKKPDRMITG